MHILVKPVFYMQIKKLKILHQIHESKITNAQKYKRKTVNTNIPIKIDPSIPRCHTK